jgi:hypothetical protein
MNNLWNSDNHSINIVLLILFHICIFIITSSITAYETTKDIKKALLEPSREQKSPLFEKAVILISSISILFGIDINISYESEILFALFFCLVIISSNIDRMYFDIKIFLTGQIILVAFIGCILFADLLM